MTVWRLHGCRIDEWDSGLFVLYFNRRKVAPFTTFRNAQAYALEEFIE